VVSGSEPDDDPLSANGLEGLRRRCRGLLRSVAPVEWAALVGGLIFLFRYAWVMDDAFVYFRYVDNLLYLDRGLVWNPGELVEGFSSPAWSLLLILLRPSGINFWVLTCSVGVASLLTSWILLIALNRRLSGPSGPVVNLPLVFLLFAYGPSSYFTSGLETPLVQVFAVLFALVIVSPGWRWAQLLLGLSPLVRPELSIPFLLALIWVGVRERRIPGAMLLSGSIVTGTWMGFRIVYYADLFPNTFYLKNLVDVRQGVLYLEETIGTYWIGPLLIVGVVLALILAAASRGSTGPSEPLRWLERLVMVGIGIPVVLYVVRIGGDPRHYRYLAFPFWLTVCSTAGLPELVLRRFVPGRRTATAVAALLALTIAVRSATFTPPQLHAVPFLNHDPGERSNNISDAARHRLRPELAGFPWGGVLDRERRARYARFRSRNDGAIAGGVETETRCYLMYERFETRFVHGLGLTDPFLARTQMPPDRPAHKYGLLPLADDLVALEDEPPRRGMFRDAVRSGRAKSWIADNLATFQIVEAKMTNRHAPVENLRLALSFPPLIRP